MFRKSISSFSAAAVIAGYFTAVLNLALWRTVWQKTAAGEFPPVLAAVLPLCLFLLTGAAMYLLLWPRAGKVLIAVLLLASSAANYYMYSLNVYIDLAMVRNIFATNPGEIGEMITVDGILWVLVTGAVPAVLLFLVPVTFRQPLREAGHKLAAAAACCAVCLVIGIGFYKELAATARNNKTAEHLVNPSNYLNGIYRYVKRLSRVDRQFTVIDQDPVIMEQDEEPKVLLLAVGETARSMNFSLNGYGRRTNPRLEQQDVVSFRDVTASGTLTAFSVPCMFSDLPRSLFDVEASYYRENLLDVLQKAGYDILWLDNGVGSKGVSRRVPTVNLQPEDYRHYQSGDYLYDGVFLELLEEALQKVTRHTVIVVHMIGSHGPSYHMRYPETFNAFLPSTVTADIQNRPREEIVNAYDNTILYTDYVLSECIEILKRHPRFETAMFYVSDHGESLGENGLYLHGFPYAFAPDEQTKVPMILWMSEQMKESERYDYGRIKKDAALPASHDNYFHTVLGLAEVATEVYDGSLDLLRPHRETDVAQDLPRTREMIP